MREKDFKYIATYLNFKKSAVGNKFVQLSQINDLANTPSAVCLTSQAFKDSLQQISWEKIKDNIQLLQSNGGYRLSKIQKEIESELAKIKFNKDLIKELKQVYIWLSNDGKLKLIARSSSKFEDGEESSGAGIYESYSNIDSFEALLEGIKICWNSAFSLSAITHRLRIKEFDIHPLPGVIVQEFVNANLSGVVFSKNPLSGIEGIFIEYTTNSSDGIESGTGTANSFVAIPNTYGKGHLINERSFPRDKANELIRISETLVKHFKKEMEFEWAISRNILYILQTRPITTEDMHKTPIENKKLFNLYDLYLESSAIEKNDLGDIGGIYNHSIRKRKPLRLFAIENNILINGSAVLFVNNSGVKAQKNMNYKALKRLNSPIFTIDLGPYLRSFYTERSKLKKTLSTLLNQGNKVTPLIIREFASGEYSAVTVPENKNTVLIEICKGSLIGINRGFVETNSYKVDLSNETVILISESISPRSKYYDFDYDHNAFLLKKSDNSKYGGINIKKDSFLKMAKFTIRSGEKFGLNILEWTIVNCEPVFIDNTPLDKYDTPSQPSTTIRYLSPGGIEGKALILKAVDKLEYISSGPTLNVSGHLPTIEANKEIKELLKLTQNNENIVVVSKFPYTALSVLVGKVKGFVFESGPVLCHLAIISREEKTPIAIIEDALTRYKDGQNISL